MAGVVLQAGSTVQQPWNFACDVQRAAAQACVGCYCVVGGGLTNIGCSSWARRVGESPLTSVWQLPC
jgi:hypothetical protein